MRWRTDGSLIVPAQTALCGKPPAPPSPKPAEKRHDRRTMTKRKPNAKNNRIPWTPAMDQIIKDGYRNGTPVPIMILAITQLYPKSCTESNVRDRAIRLGCHVRRLFPKKPTPPSNLPPRHSIDPLPPGHPTTWSLICTEPYPNPCSLSTPSTPPVGRNSVLA